jgi:hypothetical protein
MIYLIGSLRNPEIPALGSYLRERGLEIFDDWYAAGPEADDYWQKYEQDKGESFGDALEGYAAQNVFEFDKRHLDAAYVGILVMPAGKSAHLELGYLAGRGTKTIVYFDKEPERWDLMYCLADYVVFNREGLSSVLDDIYMEPVDDNSPIAD